MTDPRVLQEVLLVGRDHGFLPSLARERADRRGTINGVVPTTRGEGADASAVSPMDAISACSVFVARRIADVRGCGG
jgi:hypothetical protein